MTPGGLRPGFALAERRDVADDLFGPAIDAPHMCAPATAVVGDAGDVALGLDPSWIRSFTVRTLSFHDYSSRMPDVVARRIERLACPALAAMTRTSVPPKSDAWLFLQWGQVQSFGDALKTGGPTMAVSRPPQPGQPIGSGNVWADMGLGLPPCGHASGRRAGLFVRRPDLSAVIATEIVHPRHCADGCQNP